MTETFSAEERAAMRQAAAERRLAERRAKDATRAAAELQDVLDAIAALPEADRAIAERIHEIVTRVAPGLAPRTWYGFPAYAKDGRIVAFYQPAQKFKTRYGTLGFQDAAALDEGTFWPTAFAVTAIGPAEQQRIEELIRRAIG